MTHILAALIAASSYAGNYATPSPVVTTKAPVVRPTPEFVQWKLTAYVCEASPCVTASGVAPRRGMVAHRSLTFGSVVYVEDLGELVVTDRGGMDSDSWLDVFVDEYEEAVEFGLQRREGWIVREGGD